VIEDILVGFEHAVRQPVITQELPDVLLGVEFRAFGGERHDRDVGRNDELARQMPAGLIEQEDGVLSRGDLIGDFGQVKAHRLGVARWQNQRRAFTLLRTNSSEDIGRGGSLVVGSRGARAALCPAPRNLVLLADARLIGKPDLYIRWVDAFVVGDFPQRGWEGFLKSSIAPSRCA
jgi:hypothetical protein